MGHHLAIQQEHSLSSAATGLRKWIKPSTISALAPPEWDDFTQRWAKRKMLADGSDLPAELRVANESCAPGSTDWLAKRLNVLWKSTTPTSAMEAKAWLHETGRLTKHLPQDIAAHAIDEAARQSRFTPTAAEILAVAEPLLAQRRKQRKRLDVLVNGESVEPTMPWQTDATPFRDVEVCSPDDAAAIMADCGIGRVEETRSRSIDTTKLRGPKSITVQDYIDLGLSRADAEAAIASMKGAA